MPYPQTRNIVINSGSEKEERDAIIRYHREHKLSWGMPWQEDPDGDRKVIIIEGPKKQTLILKRFFLNCGFDIYEEEREQPAFDDDIYNTLPMAPVYIDPQIIVALIGMAGPIILYLIKNGKTGKKKTSSSAETSLCNVRFKIKSDSIEVNVKNASVEDVERLIKILGDNFDINKS